VALASPVFAQDDPASAPPAEAAADEPVDPPVEAVAAVPQTYQVDQDQTKLDVLVRYDRNALIAGHDHVVQSSKTSGSLVWDVNDLSVCKINLSFPVDGLVVDPDETRTKYGFEGTTSDGDKRKIRDNMLGKKQIDAVRFPTITFVSQACRRSGEDVMVEGQLTVHGVTKPVTTQMKLTVDDGSFRAQGSFKTTHGDFGLTPYAALLGSLRNADELEFHVDVMGNP
jgi:polyisoprenoid-binding protein YceI